MVTANVDGIQIQIHAWALACNLQINDFRYGQ